MIDLLLTPERGPVGMPSPHTMLEKETADKDIYSMLKGVKSRTEVIKP